MSESGTFEDELDLAWLLKVRTVVARIGEMDLARWWNSTGQLGPQGSSVLRRGFPRTHRFAQARSVFMVAAARCTQIFDPPGSVTLWRLSSQCRQTLSISGCSSASMGSNSVRSVEKVFSAPTDFRIRWIDREPDVAALGLVELAKGVERHHAAVFGSQPSRPVFALLVSAPSCVFGQPLVPVVFSQARYSLCYGLQALPQFAGYPRLISQDRIEQT